MEETPEDIRCINKGSSAASTRQKILLFSANTGYVDSFYSFLLDKSGIKEYNGGGEYDLY